MLREDRQPRDNSERMIYTNYRAMSFIRDVVDEELTPELLFNLHRTVTEGTLDDPDAAGRLRYASEQVAACDNRDQVLWHEPPAAAERGQRIETLCRFANASADENGFPHPVVRAILLHFMIGYDHPFADGNGRTARALFYWSLARQGYWLMEYLSISSILKKAPASYARAYLYTAFDDNDTTYCIDHNLRIIIEAIDRLHAYLIRKATEVQRVESLFGKAVLSRQLNLRQLAFLSHAIRNPGELYTIESHRRSHNITYPTARSDLLKLVDLQLLEQRKHGKAFVFEAVQDIEDRMKQLGG